MPTGKNTIPVNTMADDIAIAKASLDDFRHAKEAFRLHRDDYYLFLLLEKGALTLEIDFRKHHLAPRSVTWIHPGQVHGIGKGKATVLSALIIKKEILQPEYRNLLADHSPATPQPLSPVAFAVIDDAVSLALRIYREKQDKLYPSLLKDSCNTLVGLILSRFLAQRKSPDQLSRFEQVYRRFRTLVDSHYTSIKKPAEYARQLNISAAYLYECVKKTTGHSASYHIGQRIVLEAKRLLYYSDKSVKEIAFELGYEDYPYFTRLFAKTTGMTALAFRRKNLE
ncbi:helix-turn-helix domain-containing protein [Taibaiella chishuiensis]|uniref:AraC-like DNA-binding protein n=1 Tax=Taibaiella chishuiensis TaxID=1434707 RepID=A0A2P8CVC0_9BACT|nr:helix-turn-helix domain-containing protein [Taibaiella chishuiensis]PSK88902.1 AraC-like DNA-binding protein [Taibaiella chishuiensis]